MDNGFKLDIEYVSDDLASYTNLGWMDGQLASESKIPDHRLMGELIFLVKRTVIGRYRVRLRFDDYHYADNFRADWNARYWVEIERDA